MLLVLLVLVSFKSNRLRDATGKTLHMCVLYTQSDGYTIMRTKARYT